MSKDSAYFMYFPGNYRWSAAFINIMGSIAYGGAEIGELHKIGRRLKDRAPDDDAAWFDACIEVADGVRNYADTQAMIAAGATRIGASAGVSIVSEAGR